jgi:hypothetical protein
MGHMYTLYTIKAQGDKVWFLIFYPSYEKYTIKQEYNTMGWHFLLLRLHQL